MRPRVAVVLACIGLSLTAAPALAQSAEERAIDISHNVMSPFCPGLTLHDCPSDAALDLRAEIEEWAEDGLTDGEIQDRLVAQYGEAILAVPQDDAWLIWAIPGIVLLAGLVLASRVAQRWRAEGLRAAGSTLASSPTPEEKGRLEAELLQARDRTYGRTEGL